MSLTLLSAINDYIDYVDANPDETSEDIKLLVKNIINPTLKRDDIILDDEMFNTCIKFCEKWFYYLFPYQKFLYACVFIYEKSNPDVVVFSDIFQVMGRGNGKDGMLVPLALFLTTHFYGIPNYHIDIVATSETQAIDTFNVAYNMLEKNKRIMSKMFYWNKTMIINKRTKSRMRYNTSSAKTKDGKQTGMVIFNELHAYEDDKQINVYTSGLGKVKHARVWTISTNGHLREGPFDKKIEASKQVLNGSPNLVGLLPLLFRITNEEDVHKPMELVMRKLTDETHTSIEDVEWTRWIKSNPSLKYMPVLQDRVYKDYIKIRTTEPSGKNEFYTKRMNMPMRDDGVLVTSWENILKSSYSDIENKIERQLPNDINPNAIVGIDFASFQDFTSAGFLTRDGDDYVYRSKTWICKQSKFFNEIKFPFKDFGNQGFNDFEIVDEPYIREEMVVEWVVREMVNYNVLKIVMDSHRFMGLRQAFDSHGLEEETRENKNGLIRRIRLPGSIYNMVIPIIEREFIKGTLNFGDSAIMRWAINNTKIVTTGSNLAYGKIEEKLRKNDTYMGFVHAFSARELIEEKSNTYYVFI